MNPKVICSQNFLSLMLYDMYIDYIFKYKLFHVIKSVFPVLVGIIAFLLCSVSLWLLIPLCIITVTLSAIIDGKCAKTDCNISMNLNYEDFSVKVTNYIRLAILRVSGREYQLVFPDFLLPLTLDFDMFGSEHQKYMVINLTAFKKKRKGRIIMQQDTADYFKNCDNVMLPITLVK